MAWLITKYFITAAVVVLISELAKRSDKLGGFVAALPLVNVMGTDLILRVGLKTAAQCIVSTGAGEYTVTTADSTLTAVSLLMEVVNVTQDERAKFINGQVIRVDGGLTLFPG